MNVKMKLFLQCVTFLGMFASSACELTLVQDGSELKCFESDYSTSSALAWIYLHDNRQATQTAGWVSDTQSYDLVDFSCDLNNDQCQGWTGEYKGTNLDIERYIHFGPVLDQRWNNFPQQKLYASANYYYEKVALPAWPAWPDARYKQEIYVRLHMSVLLPDSAHIILATKDHSVYGEPVYWIVVGGYNGLRSFVRLCPQGLPSSSGKKAKFTTVDNKNTAYNVLHDGTQWTHISLTLVKRRDEYGSESLQISLDVDRQPLLSWTHIQPLDVKFLWMKSYNKTGYWRLHHYSVLEGKSVYKDIQQVTRSQSVCLSITYFATTQSNLTITEYNTNNNSQPYVNSKTALEGTNEWRVERVQAYFIAWRRYRVEITSREYVYIGDIRMCSTPELYMSTLSNVADASCSSFKSREIVHIKEISHNDQGKCHDDMFGPDCTLSCSQTLRKASCSGIKTCSVSSCSCLPQFRGDNCDQPKACNDNTWGARCDLPCGNCAIHGCDINTGNCEGECQARWTGPKCDNKLPVVKTLLDVKITYYNGFDIKIWNTPDVVSVKLKYFQLQYKVTTDEVWIALNKQLMPAARQLQPIRGLRAKTTYYIRTVLLLEDGTGYTGEDVPYATATTGCRIVDGGDISISGRYTLISITMNLGNDGCDVNYYEFWVGTYTVGIYSGDYYTRTFQPVTISGLKPETSYIVYVYRKPYNTFKTEIKKEEIKTKRDRPPKLQNRPKVESTQVDSVTVSITTETDRNAGQLKYIQLQYKEYPYTANWLNGDMLPWSTPQLTLRGLKSNTDYRVRVIVMESENIALAHTQNDVPFIDVTTSCVYINASDIQIDTMETSFTVSWHVPNSSCPFSFYEYYDASSGTEKPVLMLPIVIEGLKADTEYKFELGLVSQKVVNIVAHNVTTTREPYPYVKTEGLKLIENLTDGFKLTLKSTDINNSIKYVKQLQLQYKGHDDITWMNGSKFDWSIRNETIIMQGLKSGTHYHIRAVLLEDGGRGDLGDHIFNISAKTSCITLNQSNIRLETEETRIKITWELFKESCPTSDYFILFQGKKKSYHTWPIILEHLAASNTYNFSISHPKIDIPIPFMNVKTKDLPSSTGVAAVSSVVAVIIIVSVCTGLFLVWRKRQLSQVEEQPLHIIVNLRGNGTAAPRELDLIPIPERAPPHSARMNTYPVPAVQQNKVVADTKAGASEILSHMVKLQELETYVETSLASGELRRQHALFPRGQTQPWDYGRLPENKIKNRYVNLVAYDATRVKLTPLPGDLHSDYINANYIDGYKNPGAYIATQGPKAATTVDFWRMIWQEKSNLILMLANTVENGKNKCDKYWPQFGTAVIHGDIEICCTNKQIFADFTFRDFTIKCENEERKMLQLHFTSWPDHGVPYYPQSLATYLKKALTFRTVGPIVVHCSAGVGRTGTVILADACLRMASAEGQMDPLGLLQTMRSQRPNMVDNVEQYELVHIVLIECLLTDAFSIPCTQYVTQLSQMLAEQRSILDRQFSRLNKLCQRDAARKNMRTDLPWPEEKSRFPEIAPGNIGRVVLQRPMGGSEYINAVYVDGFRTRGQFIATQIPLPDTVTDLWHLMTQTSASIVVVLNQPDPNMDQSTCQFWPHDDQPLAVSSTCKVVFRSHHESNTLSTIRLQVCNLSQQDGEMVTDEHDVTLLVLKGWKSGDHVPASPENLLELWKQLEKQLTENAPIVVTCHDGACACGLFLTSVFVVEKMKLEKEVDVGLAVRSVRTTRPQFIPSLLQYEFIHQTALAFLDSFETYANFQ